MTEGEAPRPAAPPWIDATFRNGSLTGVSVMLGFSLSFLTRWAGLPGAWHTTDLVAVALIVVGAATQTVALASLLSIRSLRLTFYQAAIRVFLAGLVLVGIGVAFAIVSDIGEGGQPGLG